MLAKKQRLTTEAFKRFFASGRRVHGTYVQLIYTSHDTFHGAAVVGKKVARTAVARNKLRRRIYHALYTLTRSSGRTGVYILVAKPPALHASYTSLQHDIAELIGRVEK